MECALFHTTALLNDYHQVKTLIDDGAGCYAAMNEQLARRLGLPMVDMDARRIEGVIEGATVHLDKVTTFMLDISGLKTTKAWAYVIPGQSEDLILGRPWLKSQLAKIDAAKSRITFEQYDFSLSSDEEQQADPKSMSNCFRITPVPAAVYTALAIRHKKTKDPRTSIFAASLADIEKALQPKPTLSMEQVLSLVPDYYKSEAEAWNPVAASQLPPLRPGIDHEIQLEKDVNGRDKEVPWGPLYNMSRDELLVLRKELRSLLNKDFIQESKSPAAAPVLFAKKPGGGLRFCVDYRGLNAITRKDRYPLPLIRETLNALSKAKWLTKLDVSAAFHKVRMAKGEEWKTAFRTRYGLYEWKVCPFGLTGAPATFQRYINWALRDYLDDFCSAYVDDILIFSAGSLQDHREKVKQVLHRLIKHGLTLDISKCEFETKSTKYLGYIVEVGRGISMDPEKTKAIKEWKPPTNLKGVQSFLGFANYYRLFIKQYTDIAKPLTDLTRKDCPFAWGKAQEDAFETMKQRFAEDPILAHFDPMLDTRVEPDSSGWATGGVLSQFDPKIQTWRPVAFYSSRHSPAECNYDIHDKELLAIIKCIKEWSSELRGLSKPFTVLTDHKNLEPFMTKKSLNERQVRWSEFLSEFNFTLEHRPGKQATIPDALSRREQDVPQGMDDSRLKERERTLLHPKLWKEDKATYINCTSTNNNDDPPCPFRDDDHLHELWRTALATDEIGANFRAIYSTIKNQERQFPLELGLKIATGECDLQDRRLRYRERFWLPNYEPLTTAVIQANHDAYLSGHPGRDATIAIIARKFFWLGMNQAVRSFIKACDVCGRTTIWRDKKKGLLKPLPLPDRIWSDISMDFITDLPPSKEDGSTILLVIVDRFGKGTVLIPMQTSQWSAEGTAKVFLQWYMPHHWIPSSIVSDRGTQFVNAFWKEICKTLGIVQRLSTAYHPETDGSTERRNQEIETYLRSYVAYQQDDWKQWLPLAQIALDNRPAASTGLTPFFLSHGYNPALITTSDETIPRGPRLNPAARAQTILAKLQEAQDFAQSALAVAQERQERYANDRRDVPYSYQVGDKVWLNLKNVRTTRPVKKLDWIHAKYTITRIFENSPHFYQLNTPIGIHSKFHTSLLRPAHDNEALPSQVRDDTQPPAVIVGEGDSEYGVERILQARTRRAGRGTRRELLVKWIGYAQPTWEPYNNLSNTEALDIFEQGNQTQLQEGGNVTG
jgi:hypothetical protein